MTTPPTLPNPWQTSPSHTSLLHLPTSSTTLSVSISGPPRPSPPSSPLIIIIHGHGASHLEWTLTTALISPFARILSYSRSGYGPSHSPPPSQSPRSISNLCAELKNVLQLTGQDPPYVLVGHSWGGNIARGFLELYGEEVAGMVLVDSYCVFEPPPPSGDMFEVMQGPRGLAGYWEAVGLDEHHGFTAEEKGRIIEMDGTEQARAAGMAEAMEIGSSTVWINDAQGLHTLEDGSLAFRKQALDHKRLSVLAGNTTLDFEKLLANAKEKGYGSEEQRSVFEEWLGEWKRKEGRNRDCALTLSQESRLRVAEGRAATHNLQMVAPELVAGEVRWVLGLDDE